MTLYIACEELNFVWDEREVRKFVELWNEGVSVPEIAKQLKRHQDEVAILVIDQARRKAIAKRPGGVWGCVG